MDKIFFKSGAKNIVKIRDVATDNTVFKLHYRVTTIVLVVASLMVSSTQFFGEPINCIVSNKTFSSAVLNRYCWVEGTFTLPKALNKKVGVEVPYKGIDKYAEGDEVIKHGYYQWVCIVFFIQACMFYIPHALWKSWEGGRIVSLLSDLNLRTVGDKKVRSEKCRALSKYFILHRSCQKVFFIKYFVCEILCFVNVVGQMFIMNRFLGGQFSTYGSDVFQFMLQDDEDRFDPMIKIFPKMTKCIFHYYGPSGDVQKMDTFCVLPLNILNEKVYVFLWFWFVILSVLTGLSLISRLVLFSSTSARLALTRSVSFLTEKYRLENVLYYFSYTDWFLLYMVGSNIDSLHFKELVEELDKQIETISAPSERHESLTR